jgi:hypothetical protein
VPERLNIGHVVAAVGAVLLLVSLFLDWYEPGVSAWTVFEIVDIALAALAVAALLPVADDISGRRISPVTGDRGVAALGMLALVLVVVSIVNNPPAVIGQTEKVGAWLGLAGALAIIAGGLLAGRRISIVISTAPRDRQPAHESAPAAQPPHQPTGPALEPEGSEDETRPHDVGRGS